MRITRAQLGDAALAAALVVIGILGTAVVGAHASGAVVDRPVDPAAYVLVAATGGALVVRRRWPLAILTVAATLTATYLAVGYPFGPILLAFFVAAYTGARYGEVARSVPVALAAVGLLMTHVFTNPAALPGWRGAIAASAWVVVPFAIGVTVKVTREGRDRERAEVIRQRIDDERLRVAQDVHDIVGHGLAAIKMQADVALHVLPKRPGQAPMALDAISRTSGEALEELRATLGAIRSDDAEARRAPEPRLPRLDELQRRMTDAGARIRLATSGSPRALPPAVDLAGYRVVQESLTNVLRHSPSKVADVEIDYAADAVVITVSNPAPDATTDAAGLGIAGMRRRVTSLGGEFSAGTTSDGRFEVRAQIPTKGLA